jgi:hypothetical protein
MLIHQQNRKKFAVKLFLILSWLLFAGSGSAQPNAFESFRSVLVDYFARQNYVPVLVNRGYTVGDVVEADGVNFHARSVRCFPHLKTPKPTPTSLTGIVESSSAGMSFLLKLKQIFDSSAGANLAKRITIKFSDVSVVAVSLLDLRDALDRKACPEIAPLVDSTITAVDRNNKPFFVVSEVLSGKRDATLTLTDQANLQAHAANITQQVADAQVKVEVTNGGIITLKSEVIAPIALKPVTVPKVVLVSQFDTLRSGQEVELKWEPLDCQQPTTCTVLFGPFADLLKASQPALSSEELLQ